MTTTVLRAVKIMGEELKDLRESDTLVTIVKAAIDVIEFTALLILPLLIPILIMIGATY